jgi:glycerate 2-kinase
MNILIAPNAFKNGCTAPDAAKAIAEGLQRSSLHCTTRLFPIGDGGDGTADLLVRRLNGKRINVEVLDPLGRKIDSGYAVIHEGKTAVIEMADASGIKLLRADELDPINASSFGTGELIMHALSRGVTTIILCIGGSATVDGATGMLTALGLQLKDKNGKLVDRLPQRLIEVDQVDLSRIDKRIYQTRFVILCDVDNRLLGSHGAAAVFGPQKGADQAAVIFLESALSHWRNKLFEATGKDIALLKHGGAAGGTSAGLHAVINAELVSGIEYFLDITGFDEEVEAADLVITGEGSIDEQTFHGKGPYGVAARCNAKAKPVIALSGKLSASPDPEWHRHFSSLLAIANGPMTLTEALQHTIPNLLRTGLEIGNLISVGKEAAKND